MRTIGELTDATGRRGVRASLSAQTVVIQALSREGTADEWPATA